MSLNCWDRLPFPSKMGVAVGWPDHQHNRTSQMLFPEDRCYWSARGRTPLFILVSALRQPSLECTTKLRFDNISMMKPTLCLSGMVLSSFRIGSRGTEGEILHIVLAGEWLGGAQRVRNSLCSKEQSAEHDWTRKQLYRTNSTTQHHCRPSRPCQHVCPYNVHNIGYKRRVLR